MKKPDIVYIPETHEYFIDDKKYLSVTEILGLEGITDYSAIPSKILTPAQKLGDAVHKACELYNKGTLDMDSVDKPVIPYLNAFIKFMGDYQIEILGIEEIIYSIKRRFAGRLDLRGKIDKKLAVVDIKTSTVVDKSCGVQLGGYKVGLEEMYGLKIPLKWVLQLKPDGTYQVHPFNSLSDEMVFLGALNVRIWKMANGKGGKNERNIK